ncbi:MAG TPA: hypothetical protein VI670_28120 [Thermoanaerobaculia bacterium]|jgi:hypothetical protein
MSGLTIYLDEMEDRDRKQRRRTKIVGAIAIVATLMAMRRPVATPAPPPAPEPIVIVKTETVAVPFVVTRMQRVTKNVTVREPRYYKLLPAKWPSDPPPPSGLTRHLCVTPKRLIVAGVKDDITVSNVGDTPLRITAIGTLPERSGFVIDDSDCANKQLEAGGRCTIRIVEHETRSERMSMYLRIDDDRGDYDIAEITASPASRGPAS